MKAVHGTLLAYFLLFAVCGASTIRGRKVLNKPWDGTEEPECSPWDPRCDEQGKAVERLAGTGRNLRDAQEGDRYITLPCDCHTVILHNAKTSQLICYKNEVGAPPSRQCAYSKTEYDCTEEVTLPAGLVGPLAGSALSCSYLKNPTSVDSMQRRA